MRRKVLLPTDFSKNAYHAIQYAQQLYKNENCDFYLLNVFSATSNIFDSLLNMEPGSELYETAKLQSENGLAKVYDMITMSDYDNPKHRFETISMFNNTIEAIKYVVEKKDIEMIIMGTKGETDADESFFGSIAVYVMEKVRNCPVIVVPSRAKKTLPKEIVFPTSYKTHYKRRELTYLTDIATKCNARIAVLHISKDDKLDKEQKENQDLLKEILKRLNTVSILFQGIQ